MLFYFTGTSVISQLISLLPIPLKQTASIQKITRNSNQTSKHLQHAIVNYSQLFFYIVAIFGHTYLFISLLMHSISAVSDKI